MFGKCCLGPHSTPEDVKSAKINEIPGWVDDADLDDFSFFCSVGGVYGGGPGW